MADQGRWFKLWITANTDPDLENLTLENFGRWCRFGAFLKAHGTRGTIKIKPPGKALCNLFRVPKFDDILVIFRLFPNTEIRYGKDTVTVEVTWRNWLKYQEDTTAASRNKKARALRSKKRGEEKRIKPPLYSPLESFPSRNPKIQRPELVFDFWVWGFEKKNPKFTKDRKGKINARFKEGHTEFDLVQAIVGCNNDEWHTERGVNDLKVILRDTTYVERLQSKAKESEVNDAVKDWKKETGKGSLWKNSSKELVHSGGSGEDEKSGNREVET